MKVSVVIAAFNRARELPVALESVLRQSHQDLEVVVVDDGSTDTTASVAQKFAQDDPRVRLMRLPENRGASAARNAGVAAATGDAVIVWDSDDRLYPEALSRMVAVFEQHPGISVVSAPARLLYGGVPDPAQKPRESAEVPIAGVLCKSPVRSDEKVRLALAADMKSVAYGLPHLDFLVNVALAERGRWRRIGDFLGEVEAGPRQGSLTSSRKKKIPAASAARAAALRPFLERHAATMRANCPVRLAAFEWGTAWGSLLGGEARHSRQLSRAAVRDAPFSGRAWLVLLAAHIPLAGSLARFFWRT